jgi:acetolactate synthase regulatory subunit
MFVKVRVTAKNEETLLPRVLRVLAKQGLHIRSLQLEAEDDVL